jgi:glycosyltransferase involved in cell wall biosynthesis
VSVTDRLSSPDEGAPVLAATIEPPAALAEAVQRPLKVLHVIDSFGMGGAETWLIELLRRWRAEGGLIRADVLATGGRPDRLDDEATALGAQIHYLPFGRWRLPAFARGLRRILRDGGYDAIHDHQDHASGWHYLIGHGRLPAVRITHVHNPAYQIRDTYGVTARRRLTGLVGKRLVARYATHIVGTSREAITAYGFDAPAFRRTPKAALYCGLDPGRFAANPAARASVRAEFGWPQDATVVLFAGRFDASPDLGHPRNHKNSGFAVQVAIDCARQDPHVRFIFAGKFSEATPHLHQRIEQAGIGDRIAFAGVRRDIERLMASADALFFPSRAEGLGMVAVEAQAAGVPVLASTGVPRECVVTPELVRFLDVDAGAAAWRDALLALVRAPRVDPACANRQVAGSPFAIAYSAQRLAELYRSGGRP